jgi:Rps23 Pro-64 3,4-dihydroxylase Tpa1-like proline 4-hydroxylase
MKLTYSIPGKLWWIQNFLDYPFYKGLHDAIIKDRKKIKLHSAKGIWPQELHTNIKAPYRSQVEKYKPFDQLKILVRHNPFLKVEAKEMSTIIHYMKKDSGINWHDDGTWKYGATYYINRRWNINWGGEFMFTNETGHGFLPVIGNSLVIVKSPIQHKVNPVVSPIVPRISIQIFMR